MKVRLATSAGGVPRECPQHMTVPAVVRPQEWDPPIDTEAQVSPVGGVHRSWPEYPQHTISSAVVRPQECSTPTDTEVKVTPERRLLEGGALGSVGGVSCPLPWPQHWTAPAAVTPQAWLFPSDTEVKVTPVGGVSLP